jgi:hypothetical protein
MAALLLISVFMVGASTAPAAAGTIGSAGLCAVTPITETLILKGNDPAFPTGQGFQALSFP